MRRTYQEEMYNKARESLKIHTGVCIVLPCRAGKSYIMKEMVDSACKKGKKVLILAHRRLLLRQHGELIKNCRIESVFTEINHLGENGPVDLIIIDEAHISGSETYHKVCEYYNCKRVLFTATAKRLDNKPLDLADEIINRMLNRELLYIPKYDETYKAVIERYNENPVEFGLSSYKYKQESGRIETYISRSTKNRTMMAVSSSGRKAVTNYKVLEINGGYTLCEFSLETGRTHQIRVHSKHIGHPIVGDLVYGFKNQKFKLSGQLLHARNLSFCHPTTNELVSFDAPIPEYFTNILKKLNFKTKF
jgi:superfamily II DNA or RNA helicase